MSLEQSGNIGGANQSQKTDAELFLLLQEGQTDALATLYDRHAPLIYGISIKLLGNTAEAEDLTQDIFLKLTDNCAYDCQRGTLRTYLAILTRSRAKDRLRARNRDRQRLQKQALSEGETTISPQMEELSQVERSREVQSALNQLSTPEREVLKMAYYQGFSQSEIAERLNIALGTVKSRSRRGLLKLRQALINSRGQS